MSDSDAGARLVEERRQIQARLARQREEGWLLGEGPGAQELAAYDNHPADVGTSLYERGKEFGERRQLLDRLLRVESALERVRAGTYGRCLRCGRDIGLARLEAVPEAELCRACKDEVAPASLGGRPPEEAVVRPPFGRPAEGAPARGGLDGEDAWDAVEVYGTSSTPQDEGRAGPTPGGRGDRRNRGGRGGREGA